MRTFWRLIMGITLLALIVELHGVWSPMPDDTLSEYVTPLIHHSHFTWWSSLVAWCLFLTWLTWHWYARRR